MSAVSKKYRRIYQSLTNLELQQDKPSNKLISDDEILGDLTLKERPRLFLDFYSEEGIYRALEEYGIFKDLRKRGFHNFIIVTDTKDPYQHKLRAYYDVKKSDHLLAEAYLRKKTFISKPIFQSTIAGRQYTFIVIEWLMLQDPTAKFTVHRPQLPGQKYPGLRIGRKVLSIFHNMAVRLQTDGLINVPEQYHNAFFYGRIFKYFNPQTEGYFRAIQRDLRMIRLNKAAWGIEWECLFEKKSRTYWKWLTDEQIYPVSKEMIKYFESKEYELNVNDAYKSVSFRIDMEKFEKMRTSAANRDLDFISDVP